MALPLDQQITLNWIRQNMTDDGLDFFFSSTDIEVTLPDWGIRHLGITHTPGTYSRAFRRLRESMPHPTSFGLVRGFIHIVPHTPPGKHTRTKHFRAFYHP